MVEIHYIPIFQKFGVEENDVHRALLSGDPMDQLAIAYNLIMDNNRRGEDGKRCFCNINILHLCIGVYRIILLNSINQQA